MKNAWPPEAEHLENFDPVICSDDAEQLRVYFRANGMSTFTKSPLGGMLDNAAMFSPNYEPCVYCGGVVGDGETIEDVSGSGFVVNPEGWTAIQKRKYRGRLASDGFGVLAEHVKPGDDCLMCGTRGWIQTSRKPGKQVTAQPRKDAGINRETSSRCDVDVLLGTCIMVESVLDRADVLFPMASKVLAALYSVKYCSSLNAWHFTPAGRGMLRGNVRDQTPESYFAQVVFENSLNKKKQTEKKIAEVEDQARLLIDLSGKAWNAAYMVYRCGL